MVPDFQFVGSWVPKFKHIGMLVTFFDPQLGLFGHRYKRRIEYQIKFYQKNPDTKIRIFWAILESEMAISYSSK